jgi:hypothetical protein
MYDFRVRRNTFQYTTYIVFSTFTKQGGGPRGGAHKGQAGAGQLTAKIHGGGVMGVLYPRAMYIASSVTAYIIDVRFIQRVVGSSRFGPASARGSMEA